MKKLFSHGRCASNRTSGHPAAFLGTPSKSIWRWVGFIMVLSCRRNAVFLEKRAFRLHESPISNPWLHLSQGRGDNGQALAMVLGSSGSYNTTNVKRASLRPARVANQGRFGFGLN